MSKELPPCPVETAISLIANKWKTLIVRDLITGTKRFNELRKSIPHISQKVLTQNLREMEGDGLVTRKIYAEVPARVEYTLTPTGQSLHTVIEALREWGLAYQKQAAKEPKAGEE